MNICRVGVVGTLMTVLTMSSVSAADLYDRDYSMKDVEYGELDTSYRWYLRGDLGYGFNDGGVSDTEIEKGLAPEMILQDHDDSWSIGGGLGLYLTRGIRVDMTLDYRMNTDVFGQLTSGSVPGNQFTGDLDTLVGLANIYYDFDMGGRITPYVGVGIGFARHDISGDDSDDTATEFAWALMAGVDIDLRDRWKLDIGYRYLDMGDAQFDDKKNGTPIKDFIVEDIESHEIRVGLRYSFNCLVRCGTTHDYEPMK